MEQIGRLSLADSAGPLGGRYGDGKLEIDLFDESFTITRDSIVDSLGKRPGFDIIVILSRYILMCPEKAFKPGDWVSFRDFKDSGPLTTYFGNDIEKAVSGHFAGRQADLKSACTALGGVHPEVDAAYDLSFEFRALPKAGMILLFNDADDEFPAGCSVLFESRTEKYLDAECIAMLGAQLAARLRLHSAIRPE